jgi:cation:H+ antiporter
MILELLLIVIGFVLLVKGADVLVAGASSIARRMGVSYFAIGLTIVAFGTSMPEFVVNLIASLRGTSVIAFGNIIGSNMANILLIIGLTAAILPLDVNIYARKRDMPYALFAAAILFCFAADPVLQVDSSYALTRFEGAVLLCFFFYFLAFVLRASRDQILDEGTYEHELSPVRSYAYIAGGLVGLYLGGELIVENATTLARSYGISDILISSTIVAFGTSLPELATSLLAAYRKNSDIAIGNILGSNIFNIFLVLGVSSMIRPIPSRASFLSMRRLSYSQRCCSWPPRTCQRRIS